MDHTYIRKKLLEAYKPSEVGTWEILGEDPNCDLGGYHHEPLLETVEGTYANVVEYALTLKDFFSWGGGGRIKKLSQPKIKNVDDIERLTEIRNLEKEKCDLQTRIKEIDIKLSEL